MSWRTMRFVKSGRSWGMRGLAVAIAAMMALPAEASALKTFRYMSKALDAEQNALVYVPDGTAPAGGWPVLYLLHGLDGTAADWQTLGNIQSSLDRMIASGAIRPIMVAMPAGANSWYVDSADVKGPGDYASAIAHDLPDAIEAAFPVGEDRAHRAIAGLSMGGFGALRLGLGEPERYQAVAALSPAIWQNVPEQEASKSAKELEQLRTLSYFKKADEADVTIGLDLPPDGKHFGGAFGTPFDPHRFNAANVFTMLQRAVDAHKTLPNIYLTVGDDDSHLLWRGAIAFFETMQMDRRAIEFRVTDGDHNWKCWRSSLADALLFIDRQFGKQDLVKNASR